MVRFILILGLVISGFFKSDYIFAEDVDKDWGRKINKFGVEIQVPKYLYVEDEKIEGTEEEGEISLTTHTCRGSLVQLFLIRWSESPLEYYPLFPQEEYRFFEEENIGGEINTKGHNPVIKKIVVEVTQPCGAQVKELLLVCKFYCEKTKRHFLILTFASTIEERNFLELLKRVRCH